MSEKEPKIYPNEEGITGEPKYRTADEEKILCRAMLTGADVPRELKEKKSHPIALAEWPILKAEVERELLEEGYEADKNGLIYRKSEKK